MLFVTVPRVFPLSFFLRKDRRVIREKIQIWQNLLNFSSTVFALDSMFKGSV